MNGARTTDDQQTRIAAGNNVRDGLAGVRNLRLLFNAQREFRFQLIRGDQNMFITNMYVIQRVFLHDCDPGSSFAIVVSSMRKPNDTTQSKDFNPKYVNNTLQHPL